MNRVMVDLGAEMAKPRSSAHSSMIGEWDDSLYNTKKSFAPRKDSQKPSNECPSLTKTVYIMSSIVHQVQDAVAFLAR